MKKIILLLLLPLATLMAIDFVMTPNGLTTPSDAQDSPIDDTTTPSANHYLEPVNIPPYDSNNKSHLLITVSNGKWTSTNLNSSTYKHFYVEPGDYSSKTITLTADGTAGDRRSISLYNGNDTHPASLSEALQANTRIYFNGGSHWDIDRMSNINQTEHTEITWFNGGATHNVINRLHYKNFYSGIKIGASLSNPNNYNTIQNSYLHEMTVDGKKSDNPAILLVNSSIKGLRTVGSKFINNDIKNSSDGIHLVRSKSGYTEDVAFNGTIIDSNRIWIESDDVYYDKPISKGGILDPNGMYALGENALDIKAGSDDVNDPIIVTNNRFWGFRRQAYDSSPGACFNIMYGVSNVKIENNIMFDAQRGLAINKEELADYAAENVSIKNNIFYRTNKEVSDVFANHIYESNDMKIEHNSFIDTDGGYGMIFDKGSASVGDLTWKNNLSINAGNIKNKNENVTASGNYYYNTTVINMSGTNDVTDPGTAKMGDYTFQYEKFTTSPKNKTLTGVISTSSSPHYGVAGSSIK